MASATYGQAGNVDASFGPDGGRVYEFYRSFFESLDRDFRSLGETLFDEVYKDGKKRAFETYPKDRTIETKNALLQLMRQGMDLPELMYRATHRKSSLQEYRGKPKDYKTFLENLGNGGVSAEDEIVRRFEHYPRRLDVVNNISKKQDKTIRSILIPFLGALKSSYWGRLNGKTKELIDEVSAFNDTVDSRARFLSDPEKVIGDKVKLHMTTLKKYWNHPKSIGERLAAEILYYPLKIEKIWDLALDVAYAEQSFDELEKQLPDIQRAFERDLIWASQGRQVMRFYYERWLELSKEHKGEPVENWMPEADRDEGTRLVVKDVDTTLGLPAALDIRPLLEKLYDFNVQAHKNLVKRRDQLAITWHLLGYDSKTIPQMEILK